MKAQEEEGHAFQEGKKWLLKLVRKYGWKLEKAPERYRTPAVCLAAVHSNGRALQLGSGSA